MGKAEVEGLADWKRARLETPARRKSRGTAPNCGITHKSGNQNKAKARRRKLKPPEAHKEDGKVEENRKAMNSKRYILTDQEKALVNSYKADMEYYRRRMEKFLNQLEKAADRKNTRDCARVGLEFARAAQKLRDLKKKSKAVYSIGRQRAKRREQGASGNLYPGGSLYTGI